MDIATAMQQRQCIRAFTDQSVATELVQRILDHTRWAPSGVNTQPWQVAVVSGDTQKRITESLIDARDTQQPPNPDYDYYPGEWKEPYRSRRIACGKALYEALDIAREDKQRQKIAWYNNYHFFGAPIGLFFFIDKRMNTGSWVDMGMFIQNVMLAAVDYGLGTCPQASLAEYPDRVRQILNLDQQLALICGMSLGYPDKDHVVNQYRLAREETQDFAHWYD